MSKLKEDLKMMEEVLTDLGHRIRPYSRPIQKKMAIGSLVVMPILFFLLTLST